MAPAIHTERRIGRTIGDSQLIIGLRFVDRLHGGPQIGARIKSPSCRSSSSGVSEFGEIEAVR